MNYKRWYQIGGINLCLRSDIGFKSNTFADKFQHFVSFCRDCDVEIELLHNKEFPSPAGKLVYEKAPWQVYSSREFFYYNMIAGDVKSGILLGKISKDYKKIRIFKGNTYAAIFQKGGLTSFTSFPSDQIIFSQILFQKSIVKDNPGIILHSCGVWDKRQKQTLLFCGPSGAGKSTILKLLLKAYLKKEQILNDDRIIIRKNENSFFAYGTPWHGELPYVSNLGGVISKIYILEKSKENKIENMEIKEIFEILYKRTIRGLISEDFQRNRIEFISEMIEKVPVYKLKFSKENPHRLYNIIFS
jgi:hypothetical protein